MTDPKQFAAAFGFDQTAVMDGVNSIARFNERAMGIALDAAQKSNEIAARTTEDAIENLRTVSQVRDQPADYGKAVTDFAQKQAELMGRAAEQFGEVLQTAQSTATDLAAETGEQVGRDAEANATAAANKTKRTAKSAA